MKTMKLDGKIVRVTESNVSDMLKKGYVYCPKSEYKKLAKSAKETKVEETVEAVEQIVKTKKKKRKK